MVPIPKIPETAEEYQTIVKYLRSETFSDSILKSPITPTARSNF
ncbi:9517_t:CDS:1, partial [Ambispora leptoticha]